MAAAKHELDDKSSPSSKRRQIESQQDAYNIMANDLKWSQNDYSNLNKVQFDQQQNSDPIDVDQEEEDVNYILCPMCQTPIKPNAINLCVQCINAKHDISEGISRELVVFQCRQCERWYKNPQWIAAPLESAPLMELLLKKIGGLNKREIKLTDAKFVWTEPHSRRIIIRVTIQKEVMGCAIVEKSFEVTFTQENQQCKDCQESFTHHSWKGCIQLRQRVTHKRTFLFLEQVILKYSMGTHCIGIKEQRDGIDFYFAGKSQAQTFLSFLYSVIILDKTQIGNAASKRLISHDHKSNIANYKYTAICELPPVCRWDLCLLPLGSAGRKKCGGRCPLMLCYKISQHMHFLDPSTLHTVELDSKQYFRHLFKPICDVGHLTVFYVQSVERKRDINRKGKWICAELELVREHDLGDDTAPVLEATTHLGKDLQPGDWVKGYDLGQIGTHIDLAQNKNLRSWLRKNKMPDVFVVKRHYIYRKRRRRKWKLKQLNKVREYSVDKKMADKEEQEAELFMREIEQDFELRCRIKLYKDPKYEEPVNGQSASNEHQEYDEAPPIPDSELIDEVEEMKALEAAMEAAALAEQKHATDEDEDIDLNGAQSGQDMVDID